MGQSKRRAFRMENPIYREPKVRPQAGLWQRCGACRGKRLVPRGIAVIRMEKCEQCHGAGRIKR